jgi:hypothetical protein
MIRAATGILLFMAAILGVSDGLARDGEAASAPAASELQGGQVRFAIVLPSGQQYVELFVRQNGIQNVAMAITSAAVDNGDGTSTYGVTLGGYAAGDRIEYRVYSYLPRSPGVFSPGPIEGIWLSTIYGASPRFVGSDRAFALGPQTNGAGEAVDVEVYYASKKSVIHPAATGWELLRASPSPFSTALLGDSARMLGVYVKRCDADKWVAIGTTPFNLFMPQERSDAGTYSYSGFFNPSLPGTRMTPDYECGGHDITIPTRIGPQTLRTDGDVSIAYVVEHVTDAP